MTRIGINPARGKLTAYRPARVTVAVLTYIPHQEGYFRHRLEVLRLMIASLKAHTTTNHDLYIFDNGSCEEVVNFLLELQKTGQTDNLILSSRNLGKIGAFKLLFNLVPGEIVAYSDDDILFYQGWLEAGLAILENYPRVGMVSSTPIRDASERARKSLHDWISTEPEGLEVSYEGKLPDEWEADWAGSTGRDPREHLNKIKGQHGIFLNLKDVPAFGSASHFQFIAPKKVIVEALPNEWSGKLMGDMVELDETIDKLGYLRLSTQDRFIRHVGNTLSQDMVREAEALGLELTSSKRSAERNRHWLLKLPGSGRILRSLYGWLFTILNRE